LGEGGTQPEKALAALMEHYVAIVMALSYAIHGASSAVVDEAIHDDESGLYEPAHLDEVSTAARVSPRFTWIGVPGSEYLWGESQCPLLADLSDKTLKKCKASCRARERCHAINYNHETKQCQLMGCEQPVKTPNTRKKNPNGWAAYFIHNAMADPCHPGETLQELDDGGFVCEKGGPQVLFTKDPRPDDFCWDEHLPHLAGCWPGMDDGHLRQFSFKIRLTDNWVAHYNEHQKDFERHGYRTLKDSYRILLDKASYLYEQQFSVRLVGGTVELNGKPMGDHRGGPHDGFITFDTVGRPHSGLGCLCNSNCGMLGCGSEVFNAKGEFRCQAAITLAHEILHFFGSHHTPAYKPDIMVVDGRPTFRRCGGRPCMYHSFLPWDDSTSYGDSVCRKNIVPAQCFTLVSGHEPLKDRWTLADPGEDCISACGKKGLSCDQEELESVDSSEEVRAAATVAQQTCKHEVGWGYDFSPSICTSKDCCGKGSCTGWCTFGKNGKRSCSVKTNEHHSRLCPCKKTTSTMSTKYASMPEIRDVPRTLTGAPTVGIAVLGLLGSATIALRRMHLPARAALAEEQSLCEQGWTEE